MLTQGKKLNASGKESEDGPKNKTLHFYTIEIYPGTKWNGNVYFEKKTFKGEGSSKPKAKKDAAKKVIDFCALCGVRVIINDRS